MGIINDDSMSKRVDGVTKWLGKIGINQDLHTLGSSSWKGRVGRAGSRRGSRTWADDCDRCV